jgi:hypothetical protein
MISHFGKAIPTEHFSVILSIADRWTYCLNGARTLFGIGCCGTRESKSSAVIEESTTSKEQPKARLKLCRLPIAGTSFAIYGMPFLIGWGDVRQSGRN